MFQHKSCHLCERWIDQYDTSVGQKKKIRVPDNLLYSYGDDTQLFLSGPSSHLIFSTMCFGYSIPMVSRKWHVNRPKKVPFYVAWNPHWMSFFLTTGQWNWFITVINASAAVTLLEQRPEKIFRLWAGFEHTTSAMPVQWESTALASQRSWVRIPLRAWKFFQVSVQVVLRPHLH